MSPAEINSGWRSLEQLPNPGQSGARPTPPPSPHSHPAPSTMLFPENCFGVAQKAPACWNPYFVGRSAWNGGGGGEWMRDGNWWSGAQQAALMSAAGLASPAHLDIKPMLLGSPSAPWTPNGMNLMTGATEGASGGQDLSPAASSASGEQIDVVHDRKPPPAFLHHDCPNRRPRKPSSVEHKSSGGLGSGGEGEAAGSPKMDIHSATDSSVSGSDAEGVWSSDIDQAFTEALAIYPPCGRRKIILSDEGKMYGRNELIARYIKIRTGKTRTRKQVSSHIQVLARKKQREIHAKLKPFQDHAQKDKAMSSLSAMSSAQIISMGTLSQQLAAKGAAGYPHPGWAPPSADGLPPIPFPDAYGRPFALPPAPFSPVAALPSPAAPPALANVHEGRSIWTPRFRLVSFSAYVDPCGDAPDPVAPADVAARRHQLIRLDCAGIQPTDPLLEAIEFGEIADKFPDGRGGLGELFAKGPHDAFFLAKFWADLGTAHTLKDSPDTLYAADTRYESEQPMTITVSTKVCSFQQQVVEKVETEFGTWDESIGKHVYTLNRSPMCEYMVKFLHQLKGLPEVAMMNSVLENFTILQVVTNKETRETLLCIALVFEVAPVGSESSYHIYRLRPSQSDS